MTGLLRFRSFIRLQEISSCTWHEANFLVSEATNEHWIGLQQLLILPTLPLLVLVRPTFVYLVCLVRNAPCRVDSQGGCTS